MHILFWSLQESMKDFTEFVCVWSRNQKVVLSSQASEKALLFDTFHLLYLLKFGIVRIIGSHYTVISWSFGLLTLISPSKRWSFFFLSICSDLCWKIKLFIEIAEVQNLFHFAVWSCCIQRVQVWPYDVLFIFLFKKKEGKDEWFDTHVSLADCDESIDFYSGRYPVDC